MTIVGIVESRTSVPALEVATRKVELWVLLRDHRSS
jgi:hypothetical protein